MAWDENQLNNFNTLGQPQDLTLSGADPLVVNFAEIIAVNSRKNSGDNMLITSAKSGKSPQQIAQETQDKLDSLNRPVQPEITSPFASPEVQALQEQMTQTLAQAPVAPTFTTPETTTADLLLGGLTAALSTPRASNIVQQVPNLAAQNRSQIINQQLQNDFNNQLDILDRQLRAQQNMLNQAIQRGEISNDQALNAWRIAEAAYQNDVDSILRNAKLETDAFFASEKQQLNEDVADTKRTQAEILANIRQTALDDDVVKEFEKLPWSTQQDPRVQEAYNTRLGGRRKVAPVQNASYFTVLMNATARVQDALDSFNQMDVAAQKKALAQINGEISKMEAELKLPKFTLPRAKVGQRAAIVLGEQKMAQQQKQFEQKMAQDMRKHNERMAMGRARLAQSGTKPDWKTESGRAVASYESALQNSLGDEQAAHAELQTYLKQNPGMNPDTDAKARELQAKLDGARAKSDLDARALDEARASAQRRKKNSSTNIVTNPALSGKPKTQSPNTSGSTKTKSKFSNN